MSEFLNIIRHERRLKSALKSLSIEELESIKEKFEYKFWDLQINYIMIERYVKEHNFKSINSYSQTMLDTGLINETELSTFRKIFSDLGVNLLSY